MDPSRRKMELLGMLDKLRDQYGQAKGIVDDAGIDMLILRTKVEWIVWAICDIENDMKMARK